MATDITESLTYFLQIDSVHKQDLASIRKWTNLKVAFDKNKIWVCNFESYQIDAIEVKSMPNKTLFYSKNNKLFLLNSLLPNTKEPSLLWTPIERALPIEIKKFNHNYFGLTEKIDIKLVKDETENEAQVLLTNLSILLTYVEKASEIRLKKIQWVFINNEKVLLFGKPILPINASVYWIKNNAVIPTGYKFELEILNQQIDQKVNPDNDSWIIWNRDATYFKVDKSLLMPLSLSSLRKTLQKIKNTRQPNA